MDAWSQAKSKSRTAGTPDIALALDWIVTIDLDRPYEFGFSRCSHLACKRSQKRRMDSEVTQRHRIYSLSQLVLRIHNTTFPVSRPHRSTTHLLHLTD